MYSSIHQHTSIPTHSLTHSLTHLYQKDALISKLVFDKAVEASEQQSKQYKVRVKVKKVKEKEVIANNRVTESRTREDKAAQEDQVYVSYV